MEILALTLNRPEGERIISLSFGSANFASLFCGLIIIVISWVMIEASKIQDDQGLTI